MITSLLLAVLALVDGALCGFRAAAGRDGRIDKRAYYRHAIARAFGWSGLVVAACAGVAWLLVLSSPDRAATWAELQLAGARLVLVFGVFATTTLFTLAFYLMPIGDYRVLTSVIVLGPLTLLRPVVIAGGLAYAALLSHEPRVWMMALVAGLVVLSWERVLGTGHARAWQSLLQRR